MSYCRFGTDSDVYVYHSAAGGWRIHVAADMDKPESGKDYSPRTRRLALRKLLGLRKAGYRVPDAAIERFREEIHARPMTSTPIGAR